NLSEQRTQSIRQNDLPDALPDFRNLGVISRIVIFGNALAVFVALVRSQRLSEFVPARRDRRRARAAAARRAGTPLRRLALARAPLVRGSPGGPIRDRARRDGRD